MAKCIMYRDIADCDKAPCGMHCNVYRSMHEDETEPACHMFPFHCEHCNESGEGTMAGCYKHVEEEPKSIFIGAYVDPMEKFANPPGLTLQVRSQNDIVRESVEYVEFDGAFIRVCHYTGGLVSTCVFPIPSCFGINERKRAFLGAGSDQTYDLVDGWYDSGQKALKSGIIEDYVELAVSERTSGGTVYMAPASLVRGLMAIYTPDWELGAPGIDGSYYHSIVPAIDDSTDDPCFHCHNLHLDTVDNCGGCNKNNSATDSSQTYATTNEDDMDIPF